MMVWVSLPHNGDPIIESIAEPYSLQGYLKIPLVLPRMAPMQPAPARPIGRELEATKSRTKISLGFRVWGFRVLGFRAFRFFGLGFGVGS